MFEFSLKSQEGNERISCNWEADNLSEGLYRLELFTGQERICSVLLEIQFKTQEYWEYIHNLHISLATLNIALDHEKASNAKMCEIFAEKDKKLQAEYEKKIEILSEKVERLKKVNTSMLQEKTCIEEMLNHERDYVKGFETKLKETTLSYTEALQKAEERDSCFVHRLSELMKENAELNQTIRQLKYDLQEKNDYLYNIEEDLRKKSESLDKELPYLDNKSEDFYQTLSISQEKCVNLINELLRNPEESIDNFANSFYYIYQEENANLTKEIQALLDKNTSLSSEKEALKTDNLEKTSRIKELETEISMYTSQISFDQQINPINSSKIITESPNNLDILSEININPTNSLPNFTDETIKTQEKIISDLQVKIKQLEEENSKILSELSQIKYKTIQEIKLERIKVDEIDLQLQKFCCDHMIENPFVKMLNGIYMYNSKQMNLVLRNNSLVCKYGVVSTPIEEFLHVYTKSKKPLNTSNAPNIGQGKSEKSGLPTTSPKTRVKVAHGENENTAIEERPKSYVKEKLFSPVRKHYKRIH